MTTPIISVKNASLVVPEVVEKNLQNRPTSSSILRNSYFKRLSRGEKIVLENIHFTFISTSAPGFNVNFFVPLL